MGRERKLSHLIKYNGNSFYLNIVEDYSFGSDNVIIVKESATGDGAMVINNGRTQEEIPINGTLFGVSPKEMSYTYNGSLEQLNKNINILTQIKNDGEIIDFIGPFHNEGSNQFFIKSLKFTTVNDDNSIGFSMILSENRNANVQIEQKNTSIDKGYIQALVNAAKQLQKPEPITTVTEDNYQDLPPAMVVEAYKNKMWSSSLDTAINNGMTNLMCSLIYVFDSDKRFECKNTIHPLNNSDKFSQRTMIDAKIKGIPIPDIQI